MASIPTICGQWKSTKTKTYSHYIAAIIGFYIFPLTTAADAISSHRYSEEPLYFQFQLALSSETDFHDSVSHFDFERSQEGSFVSAISVGRKVADNFIVWPFEIVAYASVQKLNERGYQSDSWGSSLFAKAYHTFELSYVHVPVRLGFGQGFSYVSRIPSSEAREFSPYQSEKLLYYLDYSLQVPLRSLLGHRYQSMFQSTDELYVGYTVWHRSTLFGLLAEPTAGINYLGLSVEAVIR